MSNTAVLPFGAGPIGIHLPERGMSDDALSLGRLLSSALEFPNSIAVGEPKRGAFEALQAAFAAAREDDWDGLGAVAVQQSTFEYAQAFLDTLQFGTPAPAVSVDSDGEISFEWDYDRRQTFSVSIGRDGTLTYAGLFGGDKSHGTEQLAQAVPSHVALNLDPREGTGGTLS